MKSSVDITWVIGDAMIWSNVEPCIGIVSACLPTLRPLLRHIPPLRRLVGSTQRNRPSEPTNPSAGDSMTASANHSAYRSGTSKRGHFRPEEDEILLTTDVGRERRDETASAKSSGSQEAIAMQIRVNHKFDWSESSQ
jgi:gamma-glutamyl:cysteine ligase YbdK (ATP-grasp superfamily)